MNEERMKILKMIEEGVITAEEGADLLSATDVNSSTTNSKKYGFKNFIGDAVEKIKNVDFDLSFGESVAFEHESETDVVDFHDLDLMIANGSLHIDTWNENYVKAKYLVKVYQAESEEDARERFLADGQFDITNGLLRLASPSKKIKTSVKLFIPKRRYEFMKSKLTNGSVSISGMNSEHLQIKTANGTIDFEDVQGESCKLETGNGSITVSQGMFDRVEAGTINGSIKLIGRFGKSDASAVTGGIIVENHGEKSHTGFFKTITGNVTITLPNARRVDGYMKTSIGNLHCELDNYKILSNKKEVMNKQLVFEAFEEYDNAYHVEAETKTGSVTVTPARS